MQKLVSELLTRSDFGIHIIGWLLTLLVAAGTLLYKGVWARIKQLADEIQTTQGKLDRLIGAHDTYTKDGLHDTRRLRENGEELSDFR